MKAPLIAVLVGDAAILAVDAFLLSHYFTPDHPVALFLLGSTLLLSAAFGFALGVVVLPR